MLEGTRDESGKASPSHGVSLTSSKQRTDNVRFAFYKVYSGSSWKGVNEEGLDCSQGKQLGCYRKCEWKAQRLLSGSSTKYVTLSLRYSQGTVWKP